VILALREENAREREAHLHWKAEAHRLQEENARLKESPIQGGPPPDPEKDQLHARVAALVKAIRDEVLADAHDEDWPLLTAAVNAPDLAPLLAREQKRKVLENRVEAYIHGHNTNKPEGKR
jgi:hypothetical protein